MDTIRHVARHINLKEAALTIFQIAVTVGLLWWILKDGSFQRNAATVFANAKISWIVIGIVIAGIGNILGVVRWKIYLDALDIKMSAWRATELSFIGVFFNLVMIGMVGGDAVKVAYLISEGRSKAASLLSVVLDRLSGLGALLGATAIFTIWKFDWLMQSDVVSGIVWFVIAYLVGLTLFLALSFLMTYPRFMARIPAHFPGREVVLRIATAYHVFVTHAKGTLYASLISVVMLFCYIATFYCAARAFDVKISASDFFAIMPIVDIISSLPISVGGFGVREKLFETLLGQLANVQLTQAVMVSLGGYFLNAVWGIPGLIFLPFYRRSLKNAETPQVVVA